MFLDVLKQVRGKEAPVACSDIVDLSSADFSGFVVPQPVKYTVNAHAENEKLCVAVSFNAVLESACARCLCLVQEELRGEALYEIRPEDLQAEFAELPFKPDGKLDMGEVVYEELVLQAPTVFLCCEDCEGLCATCGKTKKECNCDAAEEKDPRWDALRALLKSEND